MHFHIEFDELAPDELVEVVDAFAGTREGGVIVSSPIVGRFRVVTEGARDPQWVSRQLQHLHHRLEELAKRKATSTPERPTLNGLPLTINTGEADLLDEHPTVQLDGRDVVGFDTRPDGTVHAFPIDADVDDPEVLAYAVRVWPLNAKRDED